MIDENMVHDGELELAEKEVETLGLEVEMLNFCCGQCDKKIIVAHRLRVSG